MNKNMHSKKMKCAVFIILACIISFNSCQKEVQRSQRSKDELNQNLSNKFHDKSTIVLVDIILSEIFLYGVLITHNKLTALPVYTPGHHLPYQNAAIAINELLTRGDAPKTLLDKYYSFNDYQNYEKLRQMEMLLFQPVIIDKLTQKERKELLKKALTRCKSEVKDKNKTQYSSITVLLIGRLLEKDNCQVFAGSIKNDRAVAEFIKFASATVSLTTLVKIVSDAQTCAKTVVEKSDNTKK